MKNDTSRIYILPMNLYNNQLFVVLDQHSKSLIIVLANIDLYYD